MPPGTPPNDPDRFDPNRIDANGVDANGVDANRVDANHFDDEDYPAYTMGRAAEMIGATPAFLRAIGQAGLIAPLRSEGGHRRYSRGQLRLAARARELVGQGTPVEAACRIVSLEDQLEEALRHNAELRRDAAEGDIERGTADDS